MNEWTGSFSKQPFVSSLLKDFKMPLAVRIIGQMSCVEKRCKVLLLPYTSYMIFTLVCQSWRSWKGSLCYELLIPFQINTDAEFLNDQ